MLFFDPILSGSGTRSCGTCHNPTLAWGDGAARAVGEGQKKLALRSPTLLDVAWIPRLGWDGKFRDLESVAFGPITSRANMNLPEAALHGAPERHPRLCRGLCRGVRTDRHHAAQYRACTGDVRALDRRRADALRSLGRGRREPRSARLPSAASTSSTTRADAPPATTDLRSPTARSTTSGRAKDTDIGRGRLFPTSVKLRYAFKTPTLRDVARRAPYMHDGSIATLEEVIDLYDRGGIERPSRSVLIRPLGLTDAERADLIAFLQHPDLGAASSIVPTLPR